VVDIAQQAGGLIANGAAQFGSEPCRHLVAGDRLWPGKGIALPSVGGRIEKGYDRHRRNVTGVNESDSPLGSGHVNAAI
jgi:hypothetical protein